MEYISSGTDLGNDPGEPAPHEPVSHGASLGGVHKNDWLSRKPDGHKQTNKHAWFEEFGKICQAVMASCRRSCLVFVEESNSDDKTASDQHQTRPSHLVSIRPLSNRTVPRRRLGPSKSNPPQVRTGLSHWAAVSVVSDLLFSATRLRTFQSNKKDDQS
jgi:hypothetical protein